MQAKLVKYIETCSYIGEKHIPHIYIYDVPGMYDVPGCHKLC
jgi:hypothetical protein